MNLQRLLPLSVMALIAAPLLVPVRVSAQGAGATGAQVLQFNAGTRAAALSGAYTAATRDADAVFYNPAGAADVQAAFSAGYERYVSDVTFASAAGAFRLGPVSVGVAGAFLDAGGINEIVPDPDFGGNTGTPTGNRVSASETAGRLAVALPLQAGRLRLGAAAGFVSTSLADASSGAPMFDLGAQYDIGATTVGASLRNIGGSVGGDDVPDADLPTEARLGVAYDLRRPGGLGGSLHADVISRVNEGTTGLVFGVEGGLLPTPTGVGAVARLGYSAAEGTGGLAALHAGGAVSLGRFAVDYAYRALEHFGSVHRIGIRWLR